MYNGGPELWEMERSRSVKGTTSIASQKGTHCFHYNSPSFVLTVVVVVVVIKIGWWTLLRTRHPYPRWGTVSGLGRQTSDIIDIRELFNRFIISGHSTLPPPDRSLVLVNLLICFWSSVSPILPTHNRYFDSVLWVMLWRWSFPNFILPSLPRLCPIPSYTPGYNT